MASFFKSVFGGDAPAATAQGPAGVPYVKGRSFLFAPDGRILTCVQETALFSSTSALVPKLQVKAENSSGRVISICAVSSSDASIRFGDVVTLWCNYESGKCLSVAEQQRKESFASRLFSSAPATDGAAAAPTYSLVWADRDLGVPCRFFVHSPTAGAPPSAAGCAASKPAGPLLHFGDRVQLVSVAAPGHQLGCKDGRVVVLPLAGAAPFRGFQLIDASAPGAVTTTAAAPPGSSAVAAPPPAGAAPAKKPGALTSFGATILAAGAVSMMKGAVRDMHESETRRQQYRQRQGLQADPTSAAVVAAAPHVHQAMEERYAKDPQLAAQDVVAVAQVADAVMSHPATQQLASSLFTAAASAATAAAAAQQNQAQGGRPPSAQ